MAPETVVGVREWLLVLAVAAPWAMAALVALKVLSPRTRGTLALPMLPALAALLAVPVGTSASLPWLLLGSEWHMDAPGRPLFMTATAILALAAAQQAPASRAAQRTARYVVWWNVLAGSTLGVLVARDVPTFYAFFAGMTFSAWPLLHTTESSGPGNDALSAGDEHVATDTAAAQMEKSLPHLASRVYLTMAIAGEACMLAGLLWTSHMANSLMLYDLPPALATWWGGGWAGALLIAGFGVKSALVGLHVWMPLMYAAAPAPVAAALGGATINAGVLGMLLTLPLGRVVWPVHAGVLAVLALAGVFGAVGMAVTQRRSRAVLAYSSISQMGLITLLFAAALRETSTDLLLQAAIIAYAAHHALAKGALFLGVGARIEGALTDATGAPRRSWQRVLTVLLFVLPAAALAGAPFTSGAVAKAQLKAALTPWSSEWGWLPDALSLGAVGTTLILARFLVVEWRTPVVVEGRSQAAPIITWAVSVALVMVAALALPRLPYVASTEFAGLSYVMGQSWPVLVGAVVAAWWWRSRHDTREIPAGDILWLVAPLLRVIGRAVHRGAHALDTLVQYIVKGASPESAPHPAAATADERLRQFAPLAFALLMVGLLAVLARGV
jgi:hydrogenase-4 component B